MSDENGSGANSVVEQDVSDINTPLPHEIKDEPKPETDKAKPEDHEADGEGDDDDKGSERKGQRQRQRDKLKAENDALRQENERLKQPKPEAQAAEAKSGEPQIGDFTDVLDYLKAYTKWEAAETVKADRQAQKDEATRLETEQADAKRTQEYNERLKPVIESIPDLPERIQDLYDQGMVSPQIERAVMESPLGELVTVHLVNNPSDLQVLQGMDEKQLYRSIGIIEASIKSQLQSQPSAPAKQTKAAAPIVPVGKKSSTASKSIDDVLASDDQQEFEAYVDKVKPRRY